MKKIYTKPATTLVDVAAEGMIAASLTYNPGKFGSDMLSNGKGGWSSDNWAAADCEE